MKSRYNVSACDEVFGSGNFLNILEWNQLFEGFEIFSNTFILFNSRSQLFVWHKMLLYRLCLDSTDFVIFNHSIPSLLHYSYNIFVFIMLPNHASITNDWMVQKGLNRQYKQRHTLNLPRDRKSMDPTIYDGTLKG